ncbi:hypothetical protein NBT05_12015 [Aquimarina sp. ERC-38]|uniref:hypothetical protein n=1 Tax=Aquimarina sp. ERC-38 TaxID=2949996 RepID=UPI002247877A|nr:hypothetical protein [Aquimarina sp. ERC-38]UZO79677.1 hypothetical protein NBT05_12015 [Aquimarina sp. ERC-38]
MTNLEIASKNFSSLNEEDIQKVQMNFQREEKLYPFPLWNLLNGQLADALYHTGQLVSFRRTSGNPLDPKVNVFTGINRK